MNIKDETMLLKNKLREVNKKIKLLDKYSFEEHDTHLIIQYILRKELAKDIIPVFKNW